METTDTQQKPKDTSNARVSSVQAVLMICTAILLDLIGLIPVVGQYFSLIGAFVIFGIWLLILGVPILDKIKSILFNGIVEAIPVVGEVWVGITATIMLILVDEVEGLDFLKFLKKIKGGKIIPGGLKQTLNKGTRRIENPDRTKQALERLRRTRSNTESGTIPKERQPMRDILQPRTNTPTPQSPVENTPNSSI